MYLYLYDYALDAPRYRRILARLETRLADLGISGKISRLSPLKNLRELLRDEIAGGVSTVVAVGNDRTAMQVINEIAAARVTFGIIPIGPENQIARVLGIPEGEAASDTVAARTIQQLDLGRANGSYFLAGLTVPPSRVRISCDSSFQVSPTGGLYTVQICNLPPHHLPAGTVRPGSFNPRDGQLEAYIQPVPRTGFLGRLRQTAAAVQPTLLPFRRLSILGDASVQAVTDGNRILKPPITVEVMPGQLRVIVGRQRAY